VRSEKIQLLKRDAIDPDRWESCLATASNSSPYARIDYLDALCPGWEALIMGAYEYIMPLPVKRKYGICYLYQPFLVPHLGVYGKNPDAATIASFLNYIPSNIRWIDITLNPGSIPSSESHPVQRRINFALTLNQSYESLFAGYRSNHVRNIQRAVKAGCVVDKQVPPHEIFRLAETYLGPRGHFPAQHRDAFLRLSDKWADEGKACTYGIRMGGQLLSAALFLFYTNRAYYLLVGNHPNGKTVGASHALIDAFIKDNSGKELVLDFEGSDVPSLAFFYEGFGATKEELGWLRIDRLPAWISRIKRLLRI